MNLAQAASAKLDQALTAYDAAIQADTSVTALAKLTSPVTLDGTAGSPFDFGATSGDTTMEFILQGDSTLTGDSGFLAVGENSASSLRYEQWQNTRQMGFTQGGVADYMFTPAVSSPTTPTHVTYVWNAVELTMNLYVNGNLAGTVTGVSDIFAMPTGAGFLGANPTGTEAVVGTIHRVTVYSGIVPEAQIKSHADAFVNVALPRITSFTATPDLIQPQGSATLKWEVQNADAVFLNSVKVTATTQTVSPAVTTTYTLVASNEVTTATAKVKVLVDPRLDVYDAAIAADQASGLTPLASLNNTVTLTGTAGEPFDFGASSGDVTMEFILEGDPELTGDSGFLAVGEMTSSSLRYEQWQNTYQMGFTQGGVADYMFVPGVPSPTIATHVAYVWDAAAYSMKIYVNGVASGTINGVSDAFVMPSGQGYLGANPTGGEAIVGRIFRVVVYQGIVPEATIQKHATAFTSVLRPPIITSFTATPIEIVGQGSSVLKWQVQDATGVFLNGVDVTAVTNQTVSPAVTTAYTLVASNNVATVSTKLTVLVTPVLSAYDAAIAADTAGGLTPLATLTNIVTLTGSGGVPFDFGFSAGDVTMEFILEGDPTIGADGYLAVGENSTSNLRYAQWSNTRQLGFTQLGVADYLFTPAVASPTIPTHVVFVWNATDLSMTLYTNGALAGTTPGVSDGFAMPTGAGFLGANATGGEAMVGRILRIVVYPGMVPEATIQKHATAFVGAGRGPSLSIAITDSKAAVTLQGIAGMHYRVEYRQSLSASDPWQLLQDIPSLSGTSITVLDPTPITGLTQRFYRASTAP
ncbi:MAG TPA: hypothetical protein P5055_15740 [Candidatus Paceibacterota bacterium]|nr:hypothetical protein [Verrucomicrobiota bacterium]HSA02184.1 hypothetical protein [Candidatus Paceibacterota bacterium]